MDEINEANMKENIIGVMEDHTKQLLEHQRKIDDLVEKDLGLQRQRIEEHAIQLAAHTELLQQLGERNKSLENKYDELKESQEKLAKDLEHIQTKLEVEFDDIKANLKEIKNQAYASVPQPIASQLAIHSLVWQILAVIAAVALVFVNVFRIYK